MNSLGLAYGSSSDEEEGPASRPPSPSVIVAVSPTQSANKCALAKSVSSPNDAQSFRCVDAKASIPVKPDVTTDLAASTNDEDDEMLLSRAGVPPAVTPNDASEAQQRVVRFLRLQQDRGKDFQTTLQDKKEVRNPYILEKVVEYFGIDQLHSNFSPDVFDPHGLPLHEFADALALEQKKRADARAQRQLQQQRDGDFRKLQFLSSNP